MKGFNLMLDEMLKLLRPLYGLKNSGIYWHITIKNHLDNDPGMKHFSFDLSYFTKTTRRELPGIFGRYAGDTTAIGNEDFKKKEN